MMPVTRLGEAEQRLQHPMDRGRGKQVASARAIAGAMRLYAFTLSEKESIPP